MENVLKPPVPPAAASAPAATPRAYPPSPAARTFGWAEVRHYLHIIAKRFWLIMLCFVISVTVMLGMLLRQERVYRCRATLLMSRGLPLPSTFRQVEAEPLGDYVATQQLILQSGELIRRARERINRPPDEVIRNIVRINAFPIGRTAFMAIEVDSYDPLIGAEMANALAEEYLDFKAEERMNTSQATVVSLTQQANRLHEELKKAEERALEFIRENSVVAIQERGNVAAKMLGILSAQAAQYRMERMFLEAQQPLLSKATDEAVLSALTGSGASLLSSIVMLGGSETNVAVPVAQGPERLAEYGVMEYEHWESLRRKKALLEARLTELRKKFYDTHPLVRQTLRELKEAQDALNVELQFVLRQFYSKLEALSIREQAARRVEQEWEEEALEVSRKQQEYQNIQRNLERLQRLYDLAFNRLKEIDISVGIEPESIQIMERAKPATSPVSPRRVQGLFLAGLIGIAVGLVLIFGIEYIDDSLRFPEEVSQVLGVPYLGLVPSAHWDQNDLRSHVLANIDPQSGFAEAYRNIRSALLFSTPGGSGHSYVVTSAVPKEGKTTTCVNIAVSLSQAGARVLIVDADLRRGTLHKFFGLEGGRGFSDVLIGQAKPDAVIQHTGVPSLDFVATGPFPPNPAELLLRPEFKVFVDYAKRHYDWVFFDCPPIMAVSEAAVLASLTDAALMVVWGGHTSRRLVLQAIRTIQERGGKVVGCVLNNLDFSRVGYYYYSPYYGYYDYERPLEKRRNA